MRRREEDVVEEERSRTVPAVGWSVGVVARRKERKQLPGE
jgi:hypothetical protein